MELESPLIFYSRQDGILNIQEKESMNHTFCQFLVSWNGLLLFDATWESKSKFWKDIFKCIMGEDHNKNCFEVIPKSPSSRDTAILLRNMGIHLFMWNCSYEMHKSLHFFLHCLSSSCHLILFHSVRVY